MSQSELINQPSFAAGEISPDLHGRVDQQLYYIGLHTCENFIVRQYGGAANRPGTHQTADCKSQTHKTRLIPFQFNEEQTYALEFGHLYMRVIKDGGEVLETDKPITAVNLIGPVTITVVGHGFSNGDDVFLRNIVGTLELNGRSFRVTGATTDTFQLYDYFGNAVDGSGYSAYVSGGTASRIYTLATPYEEDELFELNYAQSNDVLTVVHQNYFPRDITRTSHTNWTIALFDNKEGPFKTSNATPTTVIANATSGVVTLTASAGLFNSSMVGELFYMEQKPNDSTARWEVNVAVVAGEIRRAGASYYQAVGAGNTGTYKPDWTEGSSSDGKIVWNYLHSGFGVVKITAYTDTTHVTGTTVKDLPGNCTSTATDNWARAAWSVDEGYPASVTYHKQRFIFGGTSNQPNGIWFSGIGARTYFGKNFPILDDDPITILLDTTQVNAVRHLLPLSSLIALTSASEQRINGIDDQILATSPPSALPNGFNGASRVIPIVVGSTALFVQDMGSVVRTLQYDLNSNTFSGIDVTARSPHMFEQNEIMQWGYHRQPFSVVWVVLDSGTLCGFTYMEEQKVYAWHRHITDGEFESVCCIREGKETAAYFVVKRTNISGVTQRFVERMATRYFADIKDAYFVDCGLTYDGRNTTTTTITMTGGTTWDSPETLTLTANSAIFAASDVGNEIVFWDGDVAYRQRITNYISATVVQAIPTKQIAAAFRGVARSDWSFARDVFMPLFHLEGKAVSVLADGNVVEDIVVTNGKAVLPDPATVVHIGLPFISRMETLDIAQPSGNLKAKSINVPRVFLTVKESRAVFVGINGFDNLEEVRQRTAEIGYDPAIPAESDMFEVLTNSDFSQRGRISIQQTYPLPITITCITPEISFGYS